MTLFIVHNGEVVDGFVIAPFFPCRVVSPSWSKWQVATHSGWGSERITETHTDSCSIPIIFLWLFSSVCAAKNIPPDQTTSDTRYLREDMTTDLLFFYLGLGSSSMLKNTTNHLLAVVCVTVRWLTISFCVLGDKYKQLNLAWLNCL